MRSALGFVALAACAHAADPATIDAPPQTGDGHVDSPGNITHACTAGEYATDVAANGQVTCAPITTPTHDALVAGCSVYGGWRDSCDGCTTPPAKYGNAGATCTNLVGTDDTCTMPNLGGTTVALFGLNSDGNVNDDDKYYGSLHCAVPPATSTLAPCAPGSFITGVFGGQWSCVPMATAVIDYVRTSCSLYLGWQDGCDGCITSPTKWGFAGDGGCTNGAGANDTCTTTTLGTESITLFGLNTDGDVDDNDKVHVGLHCVTPAPAMTSTTTSCPTGQFVTGTGTDSSFQCQSPSQLVHDYFVAHCSIYFGWRDSCDGCTLVPAKWGQVKDGSCALGTGANDTCSKFVLGGPTIDMFGLNTDGDVDGNDTFYMSLHCE